MTFEEWWEKNANLVYSTSPTAMARRVWEAAISYSRAELAECRHLLKLVVCEGCDQLDHGPDKAFHGFTDPCPILERIDAALAKGE